MHYLGIDVGKRNSNWYAADQEGARKGKGTIPSDPAAAAALIDRMVDQYATAGVAVAIEAGNVTFELARAMEARGADVFVIHPLDNALIARSRKKTDAIDAKTLCEQRRRNILPPHGVYVPSVACEDLRHTVTAREALVDHRTAITNQTLHILSRYQHFQAKRTLNSETQWKALRGQIDDLRAADRLVVQAHVRCAVQTNQEIGRLERALRDQLVKHFAEERELLLSVPGIGLINTASIVAWATPVERFDSARHFASYCGLTPSVRQSGDSSSNGGTRRSGNPHLGRSLVQASLTFSNSTGEGHELWCWFDNVRRKRGWKKARVALARKLSAVCYGILVHRKPYDSSHVAAVLRRGDQTV